MLRILHTSDWHLGHRLHDLPREREHDAFLEWLLDTMAAREIDALVVAGDVFDTANPSAAAQGSWYRFLGRAARTMPGLDVVVIGGNHDSAARLDAPRPVLDALGVHIVGGLPRVGGDIDLDRVVAPLHDAGGTVAAWVAAVPFLRVADLPPVEGDGDPLVEGVRQVYRQALDAARARCGPDQALLATGHCYMTGTLTSDLSERKVLGGNQHALPVNIFSDGPAYAFLGHLHLAQAAGAPHVRYSGSPLSLSLDEAAYPHQVILVTLDGASLVGAESVPVPQDVDVLRIPDDGPGPLDAVLRALEALPERGDQPLDTLPYLEVRVALDGPEPGLRRRVDEALDGRAARLVKLTVDRAGDGQALADVRPVETLHDIVPEDVFARRHVQVHGCPPTDALLASFHELVDQAGRGGE